MTDYWDLWMIVISAIVGTGVWRALGVLIGDRIPAGGVFSEWINAVAYAMVSGVMTLIIFFPSGLMAETELVWRLAALGSCVTVMVITRQMWMGVLAGVGAFSIAMIFTG